ncbi:MAG: DUF2723 domain-containing protein [Chloroflexota bacterium]|nr:DUF2723 domain-containing protein [Chloroflexota bacterium]
MMKFFTGQRQRLLAFLVSGLALVVYLATLAPDLTFAYYGTDGGDLISAAWNLGVPHPPGYPTYTLLLYLFTRLPFRTAAYQANLLSAVFAAGAVYFFYRSVEALLPEQERSPVIPLAAAGTLAFSTLLWQQAVIAEVYTLLMFFAALLLWLVIRWKNLGGDWRLWLAAFILGLGLGNHLTLIFFVPFALILLWSERKRWLRWRIIIPSAGLLLLGLSIYIYLPIAASGKPPVNWGNPVTWQRFWWVVSAKQYQQFVFGLPPEQIGERVTEWMNILSDQFGWWGLVIVAAGIAAWWLRERRMLLAGLAWVLPLFVYAFFYDTNDSYIILIPTLLILAILWAEGARLFILIGQIATNQRRYRSVNRRRNTQWRWWLPLLILLLPLASLTTHWKQVDLSHDREAPAYITQVLDAMPEDGLVITRRDSRTFSLWYAQYVEGRRPDLAIVNGNMLAYAWYRIHLRDLYPGIIVPYATKDNLTVNDLVYALIDTNTRHRPVYATDPADAWHERFEFIKLDDAPLYRIEAREP